MTPSGTRDQAEGAGVERVSGRTLRSRRDRPVGKIPERKVHACAANAQAVVGSRPPHGVDGHVVGIDLLRTGADQFYLLEDNCRTLFGLSHTRETRKKS